MTTQELLQKKGELANQADQILTKAKGEGRYDLTSDENRQFDEIHADIAKIDLFIEKETKQSALAEPTGRRSEPTQPATRQVPTQRASKISDSEALRGWLLPGAVRLPRSCPLRHRQRSGRRSGWSQREMRVQAEPAVPRCGRRRMTTSEQWRQANEEHRAAFGSGSSSIGGYTVSDEVMQSLEVALLAFGGVRSVATVIRTSTGGPLPIPTTNDTSNKGEIIAENVTSNELEMTFGQLVLDAYKYSSKYVLASIEFCRIARSTSASSWDRRSAIVSVASRTITSRPAPARSRTAS
jgi:HK97 family phage major capsid protein